MSTDENQELTATEDMALALANMSVGAKAHENTWNHMCKAATKCIGHDIKLWKELCTETENQYVLHHVDSSLHKRTSSGKLLVSEHLTSTYKQYKSRITQLIDHGLVVKDGDWPTASEAQEVIKGYKGTIPLKPEPDLGEFLLVKLNEVEFYAGTSTIPGYLRADVDWDNARYVPTLTQKQLDKLGYVSGFEIRSKTVEVSDE